MTLLTLQTRDSSFQIIKSKRKTLEIQLFTRILTSTPSLSSCCSLLFFLLKFFSVFLQNLLVLSFFVISYVITFTRVIISSTQGKLLPCTKTNKSTPLLPCSLQKPYAFARVTSQLSNKLHLKAPCNSTLVYSYKLKY